MLIPMDPHLLRTFVAVAREGSFSAAAQELGYTQSAVSQQIAALEADLGVPLLTRRPVAPTEAGTRLLEHAGPLLLRLAAVRTELTRLAAAPSARLAIGLTPLAATDRLAAALARLRADLPQLLVTLETLPTPRALAGLATGDLDLVLLDGIAAPTDPLHLPEADQTPGSVLMVAEEPLLLALPNGHPLAGRRELGLPELVDARWIDAPEAAVPLTALRAAAHTDGFRPHLRYQGTDPHTLTALIAAGHGLAVLPRRAVAPRLTGVPIGRPRLLHRTELRLPHPGTPAGRRLVELLSD
ncbi:DNA-binding transcriptional LysR family regulator [Kitasatospora sp. GP30]|nr:DNA-binding transcriptional LysR family regulator [Kitasatospora sp. GP30]